MTARDVREVLDHLSMRLKELAEHNAVRLMFDVESLDLADRGEILQQHGFINEAGLAESGKNSLQASQYWIYAPLLNEQLNTGALSE